MSTSPYSIDLRKKVIEYIGRGNSQISASEVFGIHKNTINRRNVRYCKEGSCGARKRLGYKSKLGYSRIESFVKENGDAKLSDIGKQFGISGGHAGLIPKKLGFSYKKKCSPMWKQVKKSESHT